MSIGEYNIAQLKLEFVSPGGSVHSPQSALQPLKLMAGQRALAEPPPFRGSGGVERGCGPAFGWLLGWTVVVDGGAWALRRVLTRTLTRAMGGPENHQTVPSHSPQKKLEATREKRSQHQVKSKFSVKQLLWESGICSPPSRTHSPFLKVPGLHRLLLLLG